jgi:hypothetical protein
MTHADPNAAPPGPPHDTQTETHSEPADHDEHGHADEAIGPVNWPAWGAGALGLLVAVVMVVVFAIATQPVQPA